MPRTKAEPSVVEPIKVIRGNPEENNEEVERVTVFNSPNLQESGATSQSSSEHPGFRAPEKPERLRLCWNCKNQGKESELKKGICPDCGFDVEKMHNIFLETDKRNYQGALAASRSEY